MCSLCLSSCSDVVIQVYRGPPSPGPVGVAKSVHRPNVYVKVRLHCRECHMSLSERYNSRI